ncbi:DsbE family thiol:disulfide interchange protein [Falsirhodobacter sp. alg1]|uniref:DsbE family thiol:disulfide interchange protein n=1 Tax=Falsirhodobacter sp. alg1 TaxID=1472418 RepID=UPI00128F03C6|nr:DsbE family thiol:disulfide interchange protein [Falsirhodobacter sp. alg1]
MKPLVFLPPLIFAALAGLFYAGMMRNDPEGLPTAFAGKASPEIVVDPLGNYPTPETATFDDGHVKLVNFWASWCAPCRSEHPLLEKLAAEGMTIVGVNYKDQPANALNFLDELGNPFSSVVSDTTGRTGVNWGLYGVPETFILNGNGQIIARMAGPITPENIETVLRPALAKAQ